MWNPREILKYKKDEFKVYDFLNAGLEFDFESKYTLVSTGNELRAQAPYRGVVGSSNTFFFPMKFQLRTSSQ